MAIMILFLVLTVAFVIGTIIYLNYKKKNVNTKIKQSSPIEAQEKGKKASKKQLADLLEFKILDNMICLGNRYSYVIKLGNISKHNKITIKI